MGIKFTLMATRDLWTGECRISICRRWLTWRVTWWVIRRGTCDHVVHWEWLCPWFHLSNADWETVWNSLHWVTLAIWCKVHAYTVETGKHFTCKLTSATVSLFTKYCNWLFDGKWERRYPSWARATITIWKHWLSPFIVRKITIRDFAYIRTYSADGELSTDVDLRITYCQARLTQREH